MAVYKKVPGHETVNISTLEFDETPTLGSLNPVTSGGVAEAVGNVAASVEQTEQDMKDMEEMFLVNLPIAANTLRFSFSKLDYSPVVAGVGSVGTWKKVNAKFHNVWDWTKTTNPTNYYQALKNAFTDSENKVSIIAAGDTSNVTTFSSFLSGCSSLERVALFDTSGANDIDRIFENCSSLKELPLFNTSNVTTLRSSFIGCTSIKTIPLFDTSKVSEVRYAFEGCVNVESGALALYTQMSEQTTPPGTTAGCFTNCGKDTTTGAAELAQIPSSWGGTAVG